MRCRRKGGDRMRCKRRGGEGMRCRRRGGEGGTAHITSSLPMRRGGKDRVLQLEGAA